tara:strand:+ start:232 stop:570 length:339 start_codon:yes stop_codon:yes gene_type:complete
MFSLFVGAAAALNMAWTSWVNNFDYRDLLGIIPMGLVGTTLGGMGMGIGFSATWSIIVSLRRAKAKRKLPKGLVMTESEQRIAKTTEVFTTVKKVRAAIPSWQEIKTAWELA